ncbi:MAG TPA: response regulator transcription factor [Candidatus Dormibacteraeota bacterium]|nr:response regulator transcription factor [Candidatus Dormibacteraeota bacterium]
MVGLLEAAGAYIVVAEAEDGVSAVQLAEHHQPDLVVIEAELPELGGIEATAPIRSRVPTCTIVVLTRQAGGRLAMRAGADRSVSVESTDVALVEAVRAALPTELLGHSAPGVAQLG